MLKYNRKIVFYILIFFSIFCTISIGFSWDESFLINQGKVTINYLLSLGFKEQEDIFQRILFTDLLLTKIFFRSIISNKISS